MHIAVSEWKLVILQAEEERKRLLSLRDKKRAAGIGKPRWFSLRAEPVKAGPEGKLIKYK